MEREIETYISTIPASPNGESTTMVTKDEQENVLELKATMKFFPAPKLSE